MDKRKKNAERVFLNRFKELFTEFPQGNIKESEEPDFLVDIENGILGIEITEMYRTPESGNPILQEQESLRKQLANLSKDLFDQKKLNPIFVSLHFNQVNPLKKKNLNSIAQKTIDLVIQNIPKNDNSVILKVANNPENFPNELQAIIIFEHKISSSTWDVANSGWGYDLTTDEIQEVIDKKNKKTSNYKLKNNCEKLWLLIVTSGYNISTTMNYLENIKQHHFNSNFDRLFVLNDMREVIELEKSE